MLQSNNFVREQVYEPEYIIYVLLFLIINVENFKGRYYEALFMDAGLARGLWRMS